MRNIKFRAWDKDDKVLRSWEELILDKEDGDDYWMVGYKENKVVTSYDHKQILMQYTGLKDKNGVEIYEGDVLYVEQIDRIDPYIPHKKNVAVRYEGRDTAFVFDEEAGFVIGLYTTPRELEVIGNIYENTELLGDSQ